MGAMTPPAMPYLHAAALVWLVWLASWIAAALWTRGTVSAAPRASFRRELAIAFAGFALLFGEPLWLEPLLWQVGRALGWALVALVAVGLGVAWWARIHLGALWSGGIARREGHRIVDSGPYGLVRHPIYTGLILAAWAVAAIRATPLTLLGAAMIALGFALKAKIEERFLAAELGAADYAAYRARVPMLVPFVPPHG
jgi:protein-S-isoprenylcysteine O-methyltransferase Ste14